jgi:hypothetical protein
MTSRQSEIAGESYAASLLAQSGYDILVQYGANQPHYDLVVNKENRFLQKKELTVCYNISGANRIML